MEHPAGPILLSALDPNFVTWAIWTLAVTLAAGAVIKSLAFRADRAKRTARAKARADRRQARMHSDLRGYVGQGAMTPAQADRLLAAMREPGGAPGRYGGSA